jgi:hypothetical protein
VPFYGRVATVGTDPRFIAGLARLVRGGDAKTAERPREAAASP